MISTTISPWRRNAANWAAIGAERLAEIHRLEAAAPLQNEMIRLFRRGRAPKSKNALLRWFTSTSRVYGLIRNLVRALEASDETGDALLSREFARAEAALRGEKRAFASAHEDAAWRTILTAPYRFRTLDDSDPRIRAGVDVTKQAVQVMAERVAGAGARFLVLLIPTKESVFHPRVADPAAHVDLEKLAATERRLKIEITAFLAESDIAHLDLLPVLRDAGTQPYFGDGDGHPNAHGQALIAGAVAETLGKNGFWR